MNALDKWPDWSEYINRDCQKRELYTLQRHWPRRFRDDSKLKDYLMKHTEPEKSIFFKDVWVTFDIKYCFQHILLRKDMFNLKTEIITCDSELEQVLNLKHFHDDDFERVIESHTERIGTAPMDPMLIRLTNTCRKEVDEFNEIMMKC